MLEEIKEDEKEVLKIIEDRKHGKKVEKKKKVESESEEEEEEKEEMKEEVKTPRGKKASG